MGLFDDILGGLGWIWDNTAGAAADALWDQIVGGLVDWVINAIAWFVKALLKFFERSSTPSLTSNWFSGDGRIGPHATSPYGVIAWLSLSILLACVLLGLVQGLLAGEGAAMAGRIARDVPLAILGIVATIGVTQVLLGATDELSHAVLDGTQAGANAKALLEQLAKPSAFSAQASFVVFLLGLVAVVGAFLLWIELLIRASLIYLLMALAPLAYAAFAWQAARRVLRRLAELVVALVFSKLVVAIALAVAASALTKGPSANGGVPTGEAKVGTLLVGVIMFCLASFAPFLLLKLLPAVEAAAIAQGISRSPVRTGQSAAQTSFYMARLAGSGGASAAAAPVAAKAGSGSGSGGGAATRAVPSAPDRSPPDTARSNPSTASRPGRESPAPGAAQPGRLDLGGTDGPSKDQP